MNVHRHLGPLMIAVASMTMGVPLQACAAGASDKSATGMTTAAMKANGSGVVVQYRVDSASQTGQSVSVVINFDNVTDPAGATVSLTATGGLSLDRVAATYALPAGKSTTLTVPVAPPADGIGYLNIFTTQGGATSATSIPVQVGKAPSALPKRNELKETPEGDKVLSIPVK